MGRGWNVAVGLVSDTTWATSQAWRIVSRGSSTHGVPIGSGFSALIFFGSFLYQDKKERVKRSLPSFSVAMQSLLPALWYISCVHRYSSGDSILVTNITPLQGWKRCSLFVNRYPRIPYHSLCETTCYIVKLCDTSLVDSWWLMVVSRREFSLDVMLS